MVLASLGPPKPPVLKAQPRQLHVGHFGLWKSMCPRHFHVKHDSLTGTDQIQTLSPPAPLVPLPPSSHVKRSLNIRISQSPSLYRSLATGTKPCIASRGQGQLATWVIGCHWSPLLKASRSKPGTTRTVRPRRCKDCANRIALSHSGVVDSIAKRWSLACSAFVLASANVIGTSDIKDEVTR